MAGGAEFRVDASRALAAFAKVQVVLPKAVTKELRKLGEIVRDDARARFSSYDARTAGRYRARATKAGVVVADNPLRKTTGFHPEFGPLQMRQAFEPALAANEGRVHDALEAVVVAVTESV